VPSPSLFLSLSLSCRHLAGLSAHVRVVCVCVCVLCVVCCVCRRFTSNGTNSSKSCRRRSV
jgi:hypothetical protein